METGIYIHIPFCTSKCGYCDFYSFPNRERLFQPYLEALQKEIRSCRMLERCEIKTIYIGGGTPTVLPVAYIAEILMTLSMFYVTSEAEITIEANPGTLNSFKCMELSQVGINRVSLGVQAWQNQLLEKLGRSHRRDEILSSYEALIEAGFDNINLDLMFSLPGQTMPGWLETLERTTDLNPAHFSIYSLTIEENTPFGEKREKGLLDEVDDLLDRMYYEEAKKFMKRNGYVQYEISNFTRPGYACRHNLNYWNRGNYVGFGAGAHTFFEGVRYQNTQNLDLYLKSSDDETVIREETEVIDLKAAQEEFMFLGLRKTGGIIATEYYKQFGVEMMKRYEREIKGFMRRGLLKQDGDRYYLTDLGMDVSNIVFQGFIG